MRTHTLLIIVVVFSFLTSLSAAEELENPFSGVENILMPEDTFEAEKRVPLPLADLGTDHKVAVVAFFPKDREPGMDRKTLQAKVTTLMTFANDAFRDAGLAVKGGDPADRGLDFVFDRRNPGQIRVHMMQGQRPTFYYTRGESNSTKLYQRVRDEVRMRVRNIPSFRFRCVLVLAATDTREEEEFGKDWPGRIARGASGFCIVSLWFLSDELLATTIKEQLETFQDASFVSYPGGRRTMRGFPSSKAIGTIAHELGHALGLDHDNNSRNIMRYKSSSGMRWNYLPDAPDGSSHPKYGFTPAHRQQLVRSGYVH